MNKIINGDCIEELKKLEDNSVDAIITDPPYGLEFMGKKWDKFKKGENIGRGTVEDKTLVHGRLCGKAPSFYNLTNKEMLSMQLFFEEFGIEALRILKPGGFLLAMGGTRTYHRMTCGIEDAGFEIRDCIMWIYGSGFPKSLNVGKQVDKVLGNERKIVGKKVHAKKDFKDNLYAQDPANANNKKLFGYGEEEITKGSSEWEGWGTALKPAYEPIILARKPLNEKNVALNVLKWGTGGINIDECRISHNEQLKETNRSGRENAQVMSSESCGFDNTKNNMASPDPKGRFPANIILDEEAGEMLDKQAGNKGAFAPVKSGQKSWGGEIYHKFATSGDNGKTFYGDGLSGASRFFYCAKTSKSERNLGLENTNIKEKPIPINEPHNSKNLEERYKMTSKNNHPTVKPIKLMEYLIKLVTKEGAIVLDPFLGSGTTAIACINLKRNWIGIEKEPEYIEIAQTRIKPYLEQVKL